MERSVRRIAVIRAAALGDAVLALPALDLLAGLYLEASIDIAGYSAVWQIAQPPVEQIFSIDSTLFSGLFSEHPSRDLRRRLSSVDLLVAWTTRIPLAAVQAWIPMVHTSPHPPPGVHATDWLIASIRTALPNAAQIALSPIPRVVLRPDEHARAHSLLEHLDMERPIVIHPGAGAAWKRWPAGRFAQLCRVLREHGDDVLLIQGPADEEIVARVQSFAGLLPVVREPPVRDLAAILSAARLFIGNDSGVTHLAAAAGAPVIALFGPTDPTSWAPRGRVQVLRRCTAVAERQGKIRVCHDPECMTSITVDEVLQMMQQSMSG